MTDNFNWWDDAKFPDLSAGPPQFYWANQAMCQASIKRGLPPSQSVNVLGEAAAGVIGLVEKFEAIGGRKVKEVLPAPFNDSNISALLVWPQGAVEIIGNVEDRDVEVWMGATDPNLFRDMLTILRAGVKRAASRGRVYMVVQGPEGPQLKSVGLGGAPLIRDNYVPSVVQDFDHIVEDLKNDNPCGRIVIFDGPVGSGKTHKIQALISAAPNALFVMVPASMIQELTGPNLIPALLRQNPQGQAMVLVVEDADECLVRRDGGNMGSISSLLNISDGILGKCLNIRVVATTNAGHLKSDEDLDEAIYAAGEVM